MICKEIDSSKVGDRVRIISKTSKYRGCEAIVAHTSVSRTSHNNYIGVYPIGYEDIYHPPINRWDYDKYLKLAYASVEKVQLNKVEGENTMAKLTGYKMVAAIKQGCCIYYYAIYDDGRTYLPGDKVIVSGAANGTVHTISEIITPEEASDRMGNKNITAEVIAYIDTSAYDDRVKRRKEADNLKKKMDKLIKEMDENNKYEMYAERNPELKEMLEIYKKLSV